MGGGLPWPMIVGLAMVWWLWSFGSKERREQNEREKEEREKKRNNERERGERKFVGVFNKKYERDN